MGMYTHKSRYPSVRHNQATVAPAKHLFHLTREGNVETLRMIGPESVGTWMIEGIASTPTVTSHNHSLAPIGCRLKLPLPLLSQHGFKKGERTRVSNSLDEMRIGTVVYLSKSPHELRMRAVLDGTEAGLAAWRSIVTKETMALSVSSINARLRGVVDGVQYFDRWELSEISVCASGANPDTHLWVYQP